MVKALFSVQKPKVAGAGVRDQLELAGKHRDEGRWAEAVEAFEAVLAADPFNSIAMNDLAACLMTLGREREARNLFEKAALLDDTFVPALVNHAASLNETYQSKLALDFLESARELMPDAGYIDSAMARIKSNWSEVSDARKLYLSAWLKEFDDNRFSENFLFNTCADSSISAEWLYAEHAFWAGTLPDIGVATINRVADRKPGKIRIGYLSPDLRQHSVRYFFRPLLEAHDRERFEIFAYYEFATEDEQTRLIKDKCDHFRHVSGVTNAEFERVIVEDDLDILIELAGHTSLNRTSLLRRRLARVQMTGLGYPPTTGLSEIDFKIVDVHTAPVGTDHLYSERLLRLPNTFWCFNPMEDTPNVAPPPCIEKGYVTFGCYGNAGKISASMLDAWQQIMARVPDSRLVVKSLTFQDESAKDNFSARMAAAGIDLEKVRLVLPDPPAVLYSAYADIDVILDTYPFNGGTTTAFALWMGVPLVTLQGEVLLSRMGSTMLRELELPELIADSEAEYVEKVVALALDKAKLAGIRSSMREKLMNSPLGNGELYARQFESACIEVLNEDAGCHADADSKPCLPESVLVERATAVYRTGNYEAVTRIVRYCLKRYPKSLGAHVLNAKLLERSQGAESAYASLSAAVESMPQPLDRQVDLYLMRLQVLLGQNEAVLARTTQRNIEGDPGLHQLSMEVYRAAALARSQSRQVVAQGGDCFLSVLVHCDNDEKFAAISHGLSSVLPPQGYELLRGEAGSRSASYVQLIGEARGRGIVLLHEDVEIVSPDFHRVVSQALESFDVLGAAGVRRLVSPLWFEVDDGAPCGALMMPSALSPSGMELCVYSTDQHSENLQAVEGGLIVARASVFESLPLDESADDIACLAELEWSYRAYQAGFALAAVPALGVMRRIADAPQDNQWRQAAQAFSERHEALRAARSRFVPDGVALPLLGGEDAVRVLRALYGDGQ